MQQKPRKHDEPLKIGEAKDAEEPAKEERADEDEDARMWRDKGALWSDWRSYIPNDFESVRV